MQIDTCENISEELREKLKNFFPVKKANYVTRLSYKGPLNELFDDEVFEFSIVSNTNDPVFLYTSLIPNFF